MNGVFGQARQRFEHGLVAVPRFLRLCRGLRFLRARPRSLTFTSTSALSLILYLPPCDPAVVRPSFIERSPRNTLFTSPITYTPSCLVNK